MISHYQTVQVQDPIPYSHKEKRLTKIQRNGGFLRPAGQLKQPL